MVPSINDNDFDAKLAERVRLLEARAQQEKTKSQLQAEKPVTAQKVQSYLFNGTRYFTYGQTSMSSHHAKCQVVEETQETALHFNRNDFNQNFLAWMYRQQHIPVGNHNGTTRNGYPRQYAAYQNADIMDIYHMERVYYSLYGEKFSEMYYDGNFLHLGYNRYTGMFNHKNLHTTKFLQLKWMCQTSCKIGRKKAPNPTFEDILKLPVENRFWYPERDHSVYS